MVPPQPPSSASEFQLRPRTTAELVDRLSNLDLQRRHRPTSTRQQDASKQKQGSQLPQSTRVRDQEAAALRSLLECMVREFCKDPKGSYAIEAAALSPFTSLKSYKKVIDGFIRAMVGGTVDCGIPDVNHLACFNIVLQCPQAERLEKHDLQLGYAMLNIKNRLTTATIVADDGIRYRLLQALSAVLDTMNEVKAQGISDEEVIQPLLNLLENDSKHRELRLSQAAQYAYQALRGIPSDVSPWKKLGESAYKAVKTSATVASAVSSLDPVKLLTGIEELGNVVDLVKAITSVIEEIKPSGISDAYKGAKAVMRSAQWYVALRYTDLLIRGDRATLLKSLLNNSEFPFQEDENFLCGLSAQLDQTSNDRIIPILNEFLIEKGKKSKSPRVHAWLQLTIPAGEFEKVSKEFKVSTVRRLFSKLPRVSVGPDAFGNDVGRQKIELESPGGELLNKVWEKSQDCDEVRVFYADQVIRNYYTDKVPGRLAVERLGRGGSLPMDQCYINLAISRRGTEDTQTSESANRNQGFSSLDRRLAIWNPKESDRTGLMDLFEPMSGVKSRGSSAAEQSKPMRVLIRGQAGVGKSTLCKRIVFDCIYHDMWSDAIDRVIWLPLRQLKREGKWIHNGVQPLLHQRYFETSKEGQILADALSATFQSDRSRTLFVLDGLDEVVHDLFSEDSDLLRILLGQPRVIITTRPYAFDPRQIKDIDLEVETLGFYPGQVLKYIEAVTPDISSEIWDFVSSHPAVEGLVRIPVQLDAVCYSFEAGGFNTSDTPRTMTELYSAIELAIWKKDIVQLGKCRRGTSDHISRMEALRLKAREVHALIQAESNVLQALAFTGLFKNEQEFGFMFQQQFWDQGDALTTHLPRPALASLLSGDLDKLSFLRTSDGGSYHFLHLTYQEYFAARYFVHHWPDKEFPQNGLSAEEFLRREKYNPRYSIVWRFVAGLLHVNGNVETFFQAVEDRPYDLLGPVHQRLVMRCLAEIPKPYERRNLASLLIGLEEHLHQWWLCESNFSKGHSQTALEMTFPENVLMEYLRNLSDAPKALREDIGRTLSGRPTISPEVNILLHDFLKESRWSESKRIALDIVTTHPKAVPNDILPGLASLISSRDEKSIYAFGVLISQSDLQHGILRDLGRALRDLDYRGSIFVLKILSRQVALPEDVLIDIVTAYPKLNPRSRHKAKDILHKQSEIKDDAFQYIWALLPQTSIAMELRLPAVVTPEIIEELFDQLKDPKEEAYDPAAAILGKAATQLDLLPTLLSMLSDPRTTDASGLALVRASPLPDKTLQQLVSLLKSSEPDTQSAAASILGSQFQDFEEAILKEIVALLHNQKMRHFAIQALKSQSSLSHELLEELISALEGSETLPRESAISTLKRRRDLSNESVNKIAHMLGNANEEVQCAAALVLSEQSSLSDETLCKMIALVGESDKAICPAVADTLNHQSAFPTVTLLKVVPLLRNPNNQLQAAAEHVLLRHKSRLPDDVVQDIVSLLDHPNSKIRSAAERVLRSRRNLGPCIIELLWPRLNYQDADVQLSAARILGMQETVLPEKTLKKVIAKLKGHQTRAGVLNLTTWQLALPKKYVRDLLEDEGRLIQYLAAKGLRENSVMSDMTLTSLLSQLDRLPFINLYKEWVRASVQGEMVWYGDGDTSVIVDVTGRERTLPLASLQDAIREARACLGLPPLGFLSSSRDIVP